MKSSRADILAFTDSDCEAHPSWLSELAEPILQGRCDASTGPNYLCLRNDPLCKLEAVRAKQYCGMDTKNMAVRRDVVLSLGGFREDIRQNVDSDFYERFLTAGYIWEATGARVLHDYPSDPIGQILGTRRRGREEAKLHRGEVYKVLVLVLHRMMQKVRRLGNVAGEGSGRTEELALTTYYLAFHSVWNISLLLSVFRAKPLD